MSADYLALRHQTGRINGVRWQVLAGIDSIETDDGRCRAAGPALGRHRLRPRAGPMQFHARNGRSSTWYRDGVTPTTRAQHVAYGVEGRKV